MSTKTKKNRCNSIKDVLRDRVIKYNTYTTLGAGNIKPNDHMNNEKSPAFTGKMKLNRNDLIDLLEISEEEIISVKVGGWVKESKFKDEEFIALTLSTNSIK